MDTLKHEKSVQKYENSQLKEGLEEELLMGATRFLSD